MKKEKDDDVKMSLRFKDSNGKVREVETSLTKMKKLAKLLKEQNKKRGIA